MEYTEMSEQDRVRMQNQRERGDVTVDHAKTPSLARSINYQRHVRATYEVAPDSSSSNRISPRRKAEGGEQQAQGRDQPTESRECEAASLSQT